MGEKIKYIKDIVKNGLKEFFKGTKTMFKEFFRKETNKKQRANMWTFARLIIPIIIIIMSILALNIASPALFIATGLIAGLGAVTDYFDGKSARKHNSASEFGKLLDQISDKIFAGVLGINLLFFNINYIFVLLGELLIAGINVGYKIKHNDLDITSTKMGKLKEWPLFVTLALGFLAPINPTLFTISNISLIITTLFQTATAISYVKNNNKEVKKIQREKILEEFKNYSAENKNLKQKELVVSKEKQKANLQTYKYIKGRAGCNPEIKKLNTKPFTAYNEKQKSILEQYIDIKNILNQFLNEKETTDELELSNYQKLKEL